MPEKLDNGIVYFRSKSDAIGALVVGCLLLAIAVPALTLDSIFGIRFSNDLVMMSTYLALPLGLVLILANIRHILANGPTLFADKEGITMLFTPEPTGPLNWARISGFRAFRHQGKQHLGISLEEPRRTLLPFKKTIRAVLWSKRPKSVHLRVDGKMLDDDVDTVVQELEEMRQIYSWRT
jgi:hypothetical protein